MTTLLRNTELGLYCPQGNFYIDPWGAVPNAFITHAHSDHARGGSNLYVSHRLCCPVLKHRLGANINTKSLEWGEELINNGVKVSFHPAGHIVGSSQIRMEYKGEVVVVSGDYKTENDGLSEAFEAVRCNTFVTESTFGLPVFNWRPQQEVFNEINKWWAANKADGATSVIYAYSLGKAQRILQNVDTSIGNIYTHGAIENTTQIIRELGLQLNKTTLITPETTKDELRGTLVIAPQSVNGSAWLARMEPYALASASGWMDLRGFRRRAGLDRGFVISDHADWKGLNEAVKATGATEVLVTHGYTAAFTRYLQEEGFDAKELRTHFEGDES